MSKMIKIDYERGQVDREILAAAIERLTASLGAFDKPDFDGPALTKAKVDAEAVGRLLAEYCVPIVSVSNGITVQRLKTGDTVQTLDNGASGRVTGFSSDNEIVEFLKGNGQKAQAHVTYVMHMPA